VGADQVLILGLLSPKSVLPRFGYLTGPGGAGDTVSEATAQMFDPNDPDRSVKVCFELVPRQQTE
jgi:hypothetical protein